MTDDPSSEPALPGLERAAPEPPGLAGWPAPPPTPPPSHELAPAPTSPAPPTAPLAPVAPAPSAMPSLPTPYLPSRWAAAWPAMPMLAVPWPVGHDERPSSDTGIDDVREDFKPMPSAYLIPAWPVTPVWTPAGWLLPIPAPAPWNQPGTPPSAGSADVLAALMRGGQHPIDWLAPEGAGGRPDGPHDELADGDLDDDRDLDDDHDLDDESDQDDDAPAPELAGAAGFGRGGDDGSVGPMGPGEDRGEPALADDGEESPVIRRPPVIVEVPRRRWRWTLAVGAAVAAGLVGVAVEVYTNLW